MGFTWKNHEDFWNKKSEFNGFDQSGYSLGIKHAQNCRATLGLCRERGYKFSDLAWISVDKTGELDPMTKVIRALNFELGKVCHVRRAKVASARLRLNWLFESPPFGTLHHSSLKDELCGGRA
jgi:hypothetical protein